MVVFWLCVELTKNPVDGFSAGLADDSCVYLFLYVKYVCLLVNMCSCDGVLYT